MTDENYAAIEAAVNETNYYTDEEARAGVFLSPVVTVFGKIFLGCACLGVGINVCCLTVITLIIVTRRVKSVMKAVLLLQQAVADLLVCVLTIPIPFFDVTYLPVEYPWREFVCYVWYSQFFYWWAMLLSAFNLPLIAFEWFLEIRYPKEYPWIRKVTIWSIVVIHILALAGAVPCLFVQVIKSDACVQPFELRTPALNGMYHAWMAAWVFFAYLIPIALELVFYCYMIRHYRLRLRSLSVGGESERLRREQRHVLKSMLSVLVFIVFVGFDSFDWLFDPVDVAEYVFNSPRQIFTVELLVVNSCANPLIHVIFSPEFRDFVSSKQCSSCSPVITDPVGISYIASA